MGPKPDGGVHRGAARGGDHEEALKHLGDVAEVESVVEPDKGAQDASKINQNKKSRCHHQGV